MTDDISRFDKATVERLRDLLVSMLEVVAARMGVKVTYEKGSYHSTSYTATFRFTLLTKEGAPADYAGKARRIGLPEDSWHQTFIGMDSKRYRIEDIKTRNPKYPLVVSCVVTGKRWKLPLHWATHAQADLG